MSELIWIAGGLASLPVAWLFVAWVLGVRYIPHSQVGLVEKFWSPRGSLQDGEIIARDGKAGFQAEVLRGGVHFGYFPWQYRIHMHPLVVVSESKIGYVYARDGVPLPPAQTLAHGVDCNSFQDARAFLARGGQRGRQRAILREGVYAVNTALFVVITEQRVYSGPVREKDEQRYESWRAQLGSIDGFCPVIVGQPSALRTETELTEARAKDRITDRLSPVASEVAAGDTIGAVTVHDGPPIASGEIIAPEVVAPEGESTHENFQNPEAFLQLGGKRGRQLQVLTDGTYYINRWFATVELHPKTLVPIGYVGVVVSYYGVTGADVTGVKFRYGEQVEPGHRGVWKRALPPGKYALNPYALKIELVPTVNFVLRWITGQVEAHRYDEDLKSIELITADGYEPIFPLSLVLHIDYEKAPSVIQRFGDVRRLISQTLDPILSCYFRDVAQSSNMLDLLTHRDEIQRRGTEELSRRFSAYDINCVAVMIGRPESKLKGSEDPIERLFDQLRQRRLAGEQIETFARQQEAATKQRELNDARAAAEKQAELTQTKIGIEIAGNKAEAQHAEAQRLARRDIARAEGEARTKVLLAEGESKTKVLLAEGDARSRQLHAEALSKAKDLIGKGEAARIAQTGLAEAGVFLQKVRAYGDARLFALNILGEHFSRSTQPLVPERLFMLGGAAGGTNENQSANGGSPLNTMSPSGGVLSALCAMMLAEKGGIMPAADSANAELEEYVRHLVEQYKSPVPSVSIKTVGE